MLKTLINKVQYDLSDPFPSTYDITYKYWAKTEIVAVLSFDDGTADKVLDLNVDYSLTDPGDSGTLTRIGAWPDNAVRITIYRILVVMQDGDLRNGEDIDADVLEMIIDRAIAIEQQLDEESGRQVTVPITDPTGTYTLPPKGVRSLKFLACDADGNIIAAVGVTGVPVTTYIATLFDDEDAESAQKTLGLIPAEATEQISEFIKGLLDDADFSDAQSTLGISEFIKELLDDQTALEARKTLGIPDLFEESVTAGENINAGDPVGYADGKWVKSIFSLLGSNVQFESGDVKSYYLETTNLGSGRIAVFYVDDDDNDYAKIAILEYSGGSLNLLVSPTTVATYTVPGTHHINMCALDNGRFLIVYPTTDTTTKVRIGHYDSGLVWDCAETDLDTVDECNHPACCMIGTSGYYFAVAWAATYGVNKIFVRVGQLSGGSISWETTKTEIWDEATQYLNIFWIESGISHEWLGLIGNYIDASSNEWPSYFSVRWDRSTTIYSYDPMNITAAAIGMNSNDIYLIDNHTFACSFNSSFQSGRSGWHFVIGRVPKDANNLMHPTILAEISFYPSGTNHNLPHDRVPCIYIPERRCFIWATGTASNTARICLFAGIWNGGNSIEIIGHEIVLETNYSVQSEVQIEYLGDNTVMVLYATGGTDGGRAIVCQIPLHRAIALETKTVGQAVKIQHSGLVTGLSGLTPWHDCFVNYIDGSISQAGAGEKIGRAVSETKLLLGS